jgi:hypothetical protein
MGKYRFNKDAWSRISAVALALLTVASAHAQIDLAPTKSFYEIEGIRIPNISFRNGARKVSYTPPADWVLSGSGSQLTLTPRDSVQASATIVTESARAPVPPAAAENIKVYRELAVGLAPREATKIEVIEAVVCPMRISGQSMVEVTLTYTFFGQLFRMNVLFMARDQEQVRFQFTARIGDYPPLFQAFRRSLFSMQGL